MQQHRFGLVALVMGQRHQAGACRLRRIDEGPVTLAPHCFLTADATMFDQDIRRHCSNVELDTQRSAHRSDHVGIRRRFDAHAMIDVNGPHRESLMPAKRSQQVQERQRIGPARVTDQDTRRARFAEAPERASQALEQAAVATLNRRVPPRRLPSRMAIVVIHRGSSSTCVSRQKRVSITVLTVHRRRTRPHRQARRRATP